MDRLTERKMYNGKVCFTKCAETECLDKCAYCEVPKEAMNKLKEYEDLEECLGFPLKEYVKLNTNILGFKGVL